jgi:hypothetical protein
MTSFWQNDNIVWEKASKSTSGDEGRQRQQSRPAAARPGEVFPTKMRITMIQVAKGSTYDPKLVPNC